jgi:hypothetical protein
LAIWLVEWLVHNGATWSLTTKVTLQKNDFHTAVRFLSNKGRQQYSFRALQTDVDRMLSEPATHADFAYLERVAPEYFLNYRWNLTMAAFTYCAHEHALQAQCLQATYAAAFDTANRAIKGIDTPQPATGVLSYKIAAFVAAHFVAMRLPVVSKYYKRAWAWSWNTLGSQLAQGLGLATGGFASVVASAIAATKSAGATATQYTTTAWDCTRDTAQVAQQRATSAWGRLGSYWAGVKSDVETGWKVGSEEYQKEWHKAVDVATDQQRKVEDAARSAKHFSDAWATMVFCQQGLAAILVAPLLEEGIKQLAKRYGRRVWIASCIWSGLSDIGRPGNPLPPFTKVFVAWPALSLLHYWFSSGSYWQGVKAHAMYNLCVFTMQAGLIFASGHAGTPLTQALPADGWWHFLQEHWIVGLTAAVFGLLFWPRQRREVNPVVEFDARWYPREAVQQQLLQAEEFVGIVAIPDHHFVVPPSTAVELAPVQRDETVTVVMAPTPFASPSDNTGSGYYRIWGHNAPMFRPANSAQNMHAVITHRLSVAIAHEAEPRVWWLITALAAGLCRDKARVAWPGPSIEALADETARDGWPTIPKYPVPRGGLPDRPQLIEEWMVHTDPAKRERYRTALAVVEHSPLSAQSSKVRNVQINVKKDEVLLKYRFKPADNGMIPRPIHNVDPQLAVTIGPDVYAASEAVKRHWNFAAEWQRAGGANTNGRTITITYGAGLLASQLDEWFAFAIDHDGYHILVAGDDSVVVHNHDGVITFIEGDISKCDHSVRRLALEFEYNVLRAGGATQQVCDLLLANSSAVCVASTRLADGGTARLYRLAERNTGGVDTTVGNSVCTGGVHWLACATARQNADAAAVQEHFAHIFAKAGLALKTRVWSGNRSQLGFAFYGPSFLKGYWYPVAGSRRWAWGPLPSRFLKISKIMTDPTRVYRKPAEKYVDPAVARRRHISALAAGLAPYVWPQELKDWLLARADPAWSESRAIEEWDHPARPKGSAAPAPVTDAWKEQAAWWYDVPLDKFEDWLDHVAKLDAGLFSFHPVWVAMATRDYN